MRRRPWRHLLAVLCLGRILFPAGPRAEAATLIVPSEQYTYFWDAMDAAQPGDTIKLLPGTHVPGPDTALKDRLAVVGSGAACTRLSISDRYASLFVADGVHGVLIRDLTLVASGGHREYPDDIPRGGAFFCNASEVLIRNCVISRGNVTSSSGHGYGGAIYAGPGSSLTIVDSVLRDNIAEFGGAIHLKTSAVAMTRCILESNYAIAGGGALSVWNGGQVTMNDCSILTNYAAGGGAISCREATVVMNRCLIAGNTALGGRGGGVYVYHCDLTASNCLIADNLSGDTRTDGTVAGGAIYCSGSSLTLRHCALVGNTILERTDEDLYRRGGGLYVDEATASITNCIFWGNTEDISSTTTSELDVRYCSIEDFYPGVGVIHSPPRFVDPENGDFRLLGDSPCIDQGLDHPDFLPETDIEGNPRVIFGGRFHRPDLGAYEYDPSTPLQVCTQSLDRPIADREYRLDFKATGGFAPYSWSLLSGSLPTGLDLSPEGILCGTPDAPGIYDFTLSVANLDAQQRQQSYQLDVSGYRHWYVDAATVSPGDGTSWETALDSLQDGVSAAGDGDVVNVAPGQYSGPIEVFVPMDILGPGPDQATIDGGQAGSAIAFWFLPFGKFSGFTVTNGLADKGGGLFLYESGITVENCVVESNSANYLGGGIYANLSPAKIRDCIVRDNVTGLGTHYATQAGGGIYSYFSPLKIDRCLVENNGVIQAGYPYWGGGLVLHGSHPFLTNTLVVNNYLDSPSAYKLGAGIFALFGSPILINCTIADNYIEDTGFYYRVGGLGAAGCWARIGNCILWGNGIDLLDARAQNSVVGTPPEWAEGPGNINLDPEFVDPDSGDYRLNDTSPGIDAGCTLDIQGYKTDLDGETRVLNGLVDIGAFEHPRHDFGRLFIERASDTVTLTWNSHPGRTYAIESSADLLSWQFITNHPSAGLYTSWPDATTPQWTDTDAGTRGSRFYKVRAIE